MTVVEAEPQPAEKWTARRAEALQREKRIAQAEEREVTTRCAWCGWSTTGAISATTDAFARHVNKCRSAPTGVAERVAKRTVSRAKAAKVSERPHEPKVPKPPRETAADRRRRAKTLYDQGATPDQIATEIGVCLRAAQGYLRAEGIKLPRKNAAR